MGELGNPGRRQMKIEIGGRGGGHGHVRTAHLCGDKIKFQYTYNILLHVNGPILKVMILPHIALCIFEYFTLLQIEKKDRLIIEM